MLIISNDWTEMQTKCRSPKHANKSRTENRSDTSRISNTSRIAKNANNQEMQRNPERPNMWQKWRKPTHIKNAGMQNSQEMQKIKENQNCNKKTTLWNYYC